MGVFIFKNIKKYFLNIFNEKPEFFKNTFKQFADHLINQLLDTYKETKFSSTLQQKWFSKEQSKMMASNY